MNEKKNIIVLCPDEMRWNALGVFGQKQPVSPHLDRWAKRGAAFDHCFTVHPKCTPSRCGFLSGQYPHSGGHRTLALPLRKEENNYARHLKKQGYQTVLVGKNHVLTEDALSESFDSWYKPTGFRPLESEEVKKHPPGSYLVGKAEGPVDDFTDCSRTSNALRWMKEDRDPDSPFFLWLNWELPHPPYTVPEPFYGKLDRSDFSPDPDDLSGPRPCWEKPLHDAYGTKDFTADAWREIKALYLEMCSLIDAQVDRVLSYLEEEDLLNDTLVVFWSDHGDFAGERLLTEKWDTAMYDCITRIPLLMWGAGVPEGFKSDALIETIDLMPTLIELAGVEPMEGIDGLSFTGLWQNKALTHRESVLCQGGQEKELLKLAIDPAAKKRPCTGYYAKQEALYSAPIANQRTKMLRDHDWKYICYADGSEELYNMREDKGERHNLAEDIAHVEILSTYRRKLMLKLINAEPRTPWQNYLEA